MPAFTHNGVTLYYEETGSGYPLLLFAPGGMNSVIEFWARMPFNPITAFSDRFRVIAMDQRNAGRSHGPVVPTGWPDYAADHLALIDHLGIERTHIMGGCIGCSYCLGFIHAAGERVTAAVLQNPIGLSDTNRPMFKGPFDRAAAHADEHGMAAVVAAARAGEPFAAQPAGGPWAARIAADATFAAEVEGMDADAYVTACRSYGERMYAGDFVFSVSEDFVRDCTTPLLILSGNDDFHPTATAERIAALAPNAELVYDWREPEFTTGVVTRIEQFLVQHTPS